LGAAEAAADDAAQNAKLSQLATKYFAQATGARAGEVEPPTATSPQTPGRQHEELGTTVVSATLGSGLCASRNGRGVNVMPTGNVVENVRNAGAPSPTGRAEDDPPPYCESRVDAVAIPTDVALRAQLAPVILSPVTSGSDGGSGEGGSEPDAIAALKLQPRSSNNVTMGDHTNGSFGGVDLDGVPPKTLATLKRYCSNVLEHPDASKFRAMKLGNSIFKRRVWDVKKVSTRSFSTMTVQFFYIHPRAKWAALELRQFACSTWW
jgi:hypothetical protein